MIAFLFRLSAFVLLTLVTQIGGIAFLLALLFKRRLVAFVILYAVFALGATWMAPMAGRTALACWGDGALQVQSWFYCATNRNYVSTELAGVLKDAADAVNEVYPGTETLVLDTNFPFLTGFPLLPHLSHDDGEKADLAFFYKNEEGYLPGRTRSSLGYFAFEEGSSACPPVWLTLRWDLRPLQSAWPAYALEPERTRFLISALVADKRVGRIFLEPHLKSSLGPDAEKIRFQGCRAARHDDHIHLQL